MNKKGQVTLQSAPSIVLVVGLTFLVMATMAFVAFKYGAAMPSDNTFSTINDTLETVNAAGEYVDNYTLCNFESFAITKVINATGGETIASPNYTSTTAGLIKSATNGQYNNTDWKVSYTGKFTGVSCTVTNSLQTEIDNNTSIAGIILTISLVAIVLSVLVGVFVLARNRGM